MSDLQDKLKNVLLIAAAILMIYVLCPYAFKINQTDSMPRGLYMADRSERNPQVGDLALVKPPPYALELGCVPHPSYQLIKRVIAGAGQRVCIKGLRLQIDGQDMGQGHVKTRHGQWVTPSWSGCQTLGPDEVFVLGEHPRSCDSRVLGPLPKAAILAKAYPVWLWPQGATP